MTPADIPYMLLIVAAGMIVIHLFKRGGKK